MNSNVCLQEFIMWIHLQGFITNSVNEDILLVKNNMKKLA